MGEGAAVSCAKMAEPIEMVIALWARVGPRKLIVGGVHTGTTWQIPLNHPYAAAMRMAS